MKFFCLSRWSSGACARLLLQTVAMPQGPQADLTLLLRRVRTSVLLFIYQLWIFIFIFGASGKECTVYFSCIF